MKKFLVAFVTLAALVLASCSNTFNANDKLTTPDVSIEATENGVILLKWTPDPNADADYAVLVCNPDSELFTDQSSRLTISSCGVQKLCEFSCDANKEYKFRVYAKAPGKVNLLASDYCEVSITTPEEFVDSDAISADRIKVSLNPNTNNKYTISFPTVAGYNYQYKVVNSNISDAKALFDSNVVKSIGSFDEIKGSCREQRKETIEIEGEEKEVLSADYVTEIVVPNPTGTDSIENENYYVVVKAEPVNKGVNQTTKYAVSTESAKYIWDEGNVSPTNVTATQISVDKVRVKFTANYVKNEPVKADRFTVYYNLTQNVGTQSNPVNEKAQLVKVEGTVIACLNYDATVTAQTNSQDYYIDVPVNKFDSTGVKNYSYDFFVVAKNSNGTDTWTQGTNVTIAGETEWKKNDSPSLSNISIAISADNKVNIEYSASKTSTVKATYGKFNTLQAAKAALESEVTIPLGATKGDVPTQKTISSNTTKVNGVITNYNETVTPDVTTVKYEVKDFPLETGKTVIKTNNVNEGVIYQTSETNTNGTYYVFRVVASKEGYDDVVKTTIAYITKTTQGTSDPTYALTVENNNQGGNNNWGENNNQGGNNNWGENNNQGGNNNWEENNNWEGNNNWEEIQ